MSRSRKKNPIIKDKGFKRGERNRRVRRVNKILVSLFKEPKKKFEIVNQYDVCDYKILHFIEGIKKKYYYRK